MDGSAKTTLAADLQQQLRELTDQTGAHAPQRLATMATYCGVDFRGAAITGCIELPREIAVVAERAISARYGDEEFSSDVQVLERWFTAYLAVHHQMGSRRIKWSTLVEPDAACLIGRGASKSQFRVLLPHPVNG